MLLVLSRNPAHATINLPQPDVHSRFTSLHYKLIENSEFLCQVLYYFLQQNSDITCNSDTPDNLFRPLTQPSLKSRFPFQT